MPPDDPLRQAQLEAEGSHLVLEEIPQRLDQLEFEIVGEPAHIVVELDRGRRPVGGGTAFDHVGIERALCEEFRPLDFGSLVRKAFDEGLADPLSLFLGLRDASQHVEEFLLRWHHVQVGFEMRLELVDDGRGLVLSQEPVVHQDARELAADRLREQRGHHGRIDAAGEAADHPVAANPLTQVGDHALGEILEPP